MLGGRELDALVMKHVMTRWTFSRSSFEQVEPSSWWCDGKRVWGPDFSPNSDIAAALQVVLEMKTKGLALSLNDQGSYWEAIFWREVEEVAQSEADSPSLAICIAALQTQGVNLGET